MSKHEIGCLNHCPRGGGGGWLVLPALIAAVVVIALGYKVRHGIETGIDIGLWVTGSVAGLILVALLTVAAVKITRRVRSVQAARPARPVALPAAEPVHQITQLGTHRTVRGAIEAPRARPEAIPGHWYVKDTEARRPVPASRQEAEDSDEPRYHRFR